MRAKLIAYLAHFADHIAEGSPPITELEQERRRLVRMLKQRRRRMNLRCPAVGLCGPERRGEATAATLT